MVTEFGMSRLGPLAYGKKEELVFLGREISEQRNYSDTIAYQIDQEIQEIIEHGHERARQVISEHFDKLEAIAELLVREESIDDEQLEALFDQPRPKPDLVGPPTGRPSTRSQRKDVPPTAPPRLEPRDPEPPGFGALRPQPAG
jgi:cell division protease FtsH